MCVKSNEVQKKHSKIKYSVVIPVYNSELFLPELCQRLAKVFKKENLFFEVIMVDDYSEDNSFKTLEEINRKDQRFNVIKLKKNYGQQKALFCGLNYISGDYIITIDDDLQHPPEEIPTLINAMNKTDLDLIYGKYQRKEQSLARKIVAGLFDSLVWIVTGRRNISCSMRIIKKQLISKILINRNPHIDIDAFILKTVARNKVGTCLVKHSPRNIGRSHYSVKKLVCFAINYFLALRKFKGGKKFTFEISKALIN